MNAHLKRPIPKKDSVDLPLASDVLVASIWRRLLAFVIDVILIASITYFVTTPTLKILFGDITERDMFNSYIRLLALATFLTWGLYVTCFNASYLRATFGQKITGIYVCNVFGNTVRLAVAAGRFVIFAAPMLILIAGGMEEIISVLPEMLGITILYVEGMVVSEFFYILCLIVALVQFLLLWPLLTGNYSRVLWDDMFHTRVLLTKMRNI